MITVKQAYGIARQNSMGIKLDNVAYDLGDSWAFDYGGEEPINGFQPIAACRITLLRCSGSAITLSTLLQVTLSTPPAVIRSKTF